ncbi:MAG: shikimate kinase [Actinomycetia bacterium]|nr:shikimate kinase [Actinomycetes bacterium]
MSVNPPCPPSGADPAVRPVALVGMMAVGKTSVGAELASRLGRPFVDLDVTLVEREGRSISEIFATEGEEWFRTVETELLAEMLDRNDGPVLSTGGGVVKEAANRALLQTGALTIWLQSTPATIMGRARGNPDRPLLQPAGGEDLTDLVNRLDEQRRPLYAEVAALAVDTSEATPAQIAADLVARLEARAAT